MNFYDQFFGNFMPSQRKEIASKAGLSLPYILKHCYVNDKQPKFHFHNAVALDRASGGVLRFWEHTEGDVDWDFVLTRLREAKRNGLLAKRDDPVHLAVPEAMLADNT